MVPHIKVANMKRLFSLAILCWSVLLHMEVQAQQGPTDPTRRTPAELHQLQQEARAERQAARFEKKIQKQAIADSRTQAQQYRKQRYQAHQTQKQNRAAVEAAAIAQRKQAKQQQQYHKQLKQQKKKLKQQGHKQLKQQKKESQKSKQAQKRQQKKAYKRSLQQQRNIAKKRNQNLERHNHQLRKKQKRNQAQANRTLKNRRKQMQQLERQIKKGEQARVATEQARVSRKQMPVTQQGAEIPSGTHQSSSRAVYMSKLLQVSPRIHFGIGSFQSTMTYNMPDLSELVDNSLGSLQNTYPWVPWKNISVAPEAGTRTRMQQQAGKFFGTFGLNLPFIFMDLEVGAGRFAQPTLTFGDIWPPGELFRLQQLTNLVIDRITASKPKRSATLRIGIEGERLIPEAMLPRVEFKNMALGLDISLYSLLGVDMSYRPGAEMMGENAAESLENSFASIPLVGDETKRLAAEAIMAQIEESLPLYLWIPAMKGIGFSAKAYLDLGAHTRFVLQYHQENSKGLKVSNEDWLQSGPALKRTFFTFGISTQL